MHKPFPDPIQKTIDELGIKKEKKIYIGYSLYDMKSTKACRVTFDLAKWEAKNIEFFQNVDGIIDSPQEILDLLEER